MTFFERSLVVAKVSCNFQRKEGSKWIIELHRARQPRRRQGQAIDRSCCAFSNWLCRMAPGQLVMTLSRRRRTRCWREEHESWDVFPPIRSESLRSRGANVWRQLNLSPAS